MTSRVQKGGLIFKPVAKARPRAASTAPRQASTPAESHASVPPPGDAPTLATPSVPPPAVAPPSMPPPATVPVRAPEPAVPRLAAPPQPVASSSRTAPIVIASGSRIAVPPVITLQPRNSPAPPVIASSSRAPPPVIASSSSRAGPPIITSSSFNIPAPSPTLVNSTADDSILDKTPPEDFANLDKPPPEDFEFPEDLSQLIPPSNPSTLGPPLTVDPAETQGTTGKKTRKRKKKEMEGDAAEGEKPEKPKRKRKKKDGEGEVNAGENSEKPKKARKKRVKKEAGETADEDQPKPRRKRKAAKSADTADEDSSPPRKKRKPKPPAFDPDADPGEELDPTVITMAELCADNGQGRISSKAVEIQKNHLAWKQQSREKRARMKALAERKKYGRVEDEEETANAADTNVAEADTVPDESAETIVGPSAAAEADEPAIADATGSGFDYSQDLTASRFTVQVRIGPNGETIIDEESLTVDRNEEVDTTNYVHVVESDSTKFVNSASYTKKCRGARWSAEETDLFFEALAQHGENYELLSLVLPGRSRTACKNKFKAEDKKDSAKITRLLNSCDPIDIKTLTRLTGRDFSGPVPIIRVPTPPPVPIPDDQAQSEAGTPVAVRKRSRSRTLPSLEGVQIIGDANSYEA